MPAMLVIHIRIAQWLASLRLAQAPSRSLRLRLQVAQPARSEHHAARQRIMIKPTIYEVLKVAGKWPNLAKLWQGETNVVAGASVSTGL
jgi:hypothetical protein